MNIVLEKSSPVNAVLNVSLLQEDYQTAVDKKLKDYRKKANFKGFRPGMVPMEMVKKLYGKSVLIDEINHVLGDKVGEFIKENKLITVGEPMPMREDVDQVDWDNQKDFDFRYELGLASDFEVDFDKIPAINAYEIKADESEVNDTIDKLKIQFGEKTNPETVAEGDIVFGILAQESSEYSDKVGIPTKQITPEALAKLVGAKKEDVVTLDIQNTFIDEKGLSLATSKKGEELEALQGEFTFTIEDITRTVPAVLNQEFFDKVLGKDKATSEEDFNAQMLEIISSNYKRESDYLLRFEAEKALIDNIQIDLPIDFLQKWLVMANDGKFTEEHIAGEMDAVTRDLRWNLIKNRIAETEGIKVDYPEIVEQAKNMVRGQFGFSQADNSMDEVIERVAQNYLTDKDGNAQERMMQMYNQVFADKIADVLVTKVNKIAKEIDVKEFQEMAASL